MKPVTEVTTLESTSSVTRVSEIDLSDVRALLAQYQLTVNTVDIAEAIPGSFWGDEEAGLIGNQLYIRADTPVHSLLHESCHFICMDAKRRSNLHTNAGGTSDEENAVCYLQILLTDHLNNVSREMIMLDMNRWGYNFVLGSSEAWFKADAEDSRQWLIRHGLIDKDNQVSFQLRN